MKHYQWISILLLCLPMVVFARLSGSTYSETENSATLLTDTTGTPPTITISSATVPAGAAVSVPMTVTNFTGVGGITLKITYDTSVVTYTGIANAPTGVTFTVGSATPGVLNIGWFDVTGLSPINIASGKLVDLNFTFKKGTGSISFVTSACDINNSAGTSISGITYKN